MRHGEGRAGGRCGTLPHTDPVSSGGEQRGESHEPVLAPGLPASPTLGSAEPGLPRGHACTGLGN